MKALELMGMVHQKHSDVGQSLGEMPKSVRTSSSGVESQDNAVSALQEIQPMLNAYAPTATCQDN